MGSGCLTAIQQPVPFQILPARAIQELARYKDLAMTQRYMHLSPAAVLDVAIRPREQPAGPAKAGPCIAAATAPHKVVETYGDGEGLRREDQWP